MKCEMSKVEGSVWIMHGSIVDEGSTFCPATLRFSKTAILWFSSSI